MRTFQNSIQENLCSNIASYQIDSVQRQLCLTLIYREINIKLTKPFKPYQVLNVNGDFRLDYCLAHLVMYNVQPNVKFTDTSDT